MTSAADVTVALALREPRALLGASISQWELLIRQARGANLLPRIAVALNDLGLLDKVPDRPRAHLEAARMLAQAQAAAVRREIAYIDRALVDCNIPIVLLKGGAYLLRGLRAGRGRIFSDIDILVPRRALAEVEAALMLSGWASAKTTPYDQRYYRRWMHELPPLRHVSRQTVLDVHHAILPVTARLKPDSEKLLAASQQLHGEPRLRVLAPIDMVLHSATHLFCNEDVGNGLRDLADLDALLQELAHGSDFWAGLVTRATELDLTRPLYYALRYVVLIFNTPVPAEVMREAEVGQPPSALMAMMDAIFLRMLQPDDDNSSSGLAVLARGAVYVRAHWLRMPPLLLARHLMIKALRPAEEKAS